MSELHSDHRLVLIETLKRLGIEQHSKVEDWPFMYQTKLVNNPFFGLVPIVFLWCIVWLILHVCLCVSRSSVHKGTSEF